MINYVVCDLFLSPATVLVNTVNTEGVMGKGIAREFKQIYPEMFREYQTLCERGLFDVGKLHWYKTANKWVLNFPTKKHWRRPSEVEYIRTGLKRFVATYHEQGVTAVSFPQLGLRQRRIGLGHASAALNGGVSQRLANHYFRPPYQRHRPFYRGTLQHISNQEVVAP